MAPLSTDPMDRLPTGLKLFVRNLQSLTPAKLDDTNYPSWSATVRANLMAHRLLGYVDGTEPKPPSMILDEKAAAPAKDEPPILKPNPAHETWLVVDAQLRACLLAINIRTNIGSVTFNQVSAWLLSEELNVSLEKKLQIGDTASSSSSDIHTALFTQAGRGTYRGRGRGGYRGRGGPPRGGDFGGRGGRAPQQPQRNLGGRSGSRDRVICQLCGKSGHTVWNCWHRFDESYSGPPQAYHVNQSAKPSQNWHLDTGANAHVTSDLSRLQYSTPYHGTNSITAAGGNTFPIEHTGSVY
ncbi:unnamed protein product [Cuscuta campestris]|uniref:Retrotransposon Copia-like N-terminal domain-containing protein n=1 Tax=Cuscuta campestris TaxID=132261 RepID=A0A484N2N1_9ASTE|nr:unnamed protein product [Cuscuta campestris]